MGDRVDHSRFSHPILNPVRHNWGEGIQKHQAWSMEK